MTLSVKEEVKKLKAYSTEGNRPKVMLDANESPFELPEYIIDKIKDSISFDGLNRYPDARAQKLCEKLADYVGCGITWDMIITGDGSDELINIIISAFLSKGSSIVLPTPGFVMYNIFSSINEGRIVYFGRDENFNLNIDEMIELIKAEKPSLVFLCNPNNPTGTITDRDSIRKLIECSECMVVVDEAYFEFSELTVVDYINEYKNLIVLRTLSKAWGLAGLRLGYLISNVDVIGELLKVKSPFNVNSITQEIATLILDYKDNMIGNRDLIISERDFLIEELGKYKSIKIFDTSANFIMIKVSDADSLSKRLKVSGIAVRNFNNNQGISNCIRISIGTRGENLDLLNVIKQEIGE